MKLYKYRAIVDIVISAEDEVESKKVFKIEVLNNLDGMVIRSKCDEIKCRDDLPDGWTGQELAFYLAKKGHVETCIGQYLDSMEAKNE